MSFHFMAAVTICSDFGAQKSLSLFPLFLHLPRSDGIRYHDLSFLNVEFDAQVNRTHLMRPMKLLHRSNCRDTALTVRMVLLPQAGVGRRGAAHSWQDKGPHS